MKCLIKANDRRCVHVFLFFFFAWPARHFLLYLEVTPLDKSAELEVALKTDNVGKGQRFWM